MNRFLRSKLWHDFLKSKNAEFIKQMAVVKQTLEYKYTDEDFEKPFVCDKDFRFFESIAGDDYDWVYHG